jgi:hypothetical protein
MRCIIHKQLKEKDTNKFLKLLEYYEKELPDYNQAKNGTVHTINGFHTGNILEIEKFKKYAELIKPHIPYSQKLNLFHIHLLHFYDKGYEGAHDHQNTEDFSFILYLQNSEDGHTCFQINDNIIKIKPEKSKLIFFPSNIWHWGEASSGNKKLAVGALKIK